jgi:MoxR-like ATPase
VRAARAWAALDDRDYVLPDDVQELAGHVLPHRLLATAEAQIGRRATEEIVADILARVPLPTSHRRGERRDLRSHADVRDGDVRRGGAPGPRRTAV